MAKKSVKKTVRDEWVTLPDGRVVKNHERHEFSKPTRLLLMQMAGGMCSKPGCGVHTGGSNAEQTSHAWVHNVAHICSAAPGTGAARYNPDQTEAERKSHENGIWLCANHATIIDSDEKNYSVELLKSWKRQALKRSNDMLGQPSFSPSELNRAVHSAVGHHKSYEITHESGPLITESLGVYQARWAELDDRFIFRTSASANVIRHVITAKEGVSPTIGIKFSKDASADINDKFIRLHTRGEGFFVDSGDFEFVGSALFEAFNEFNPNFVLEVMPKTRVVDTTVYLVAGDKQILFTNFESELKGGVEAFVVQGSGLNGLFSITFSLDSLAREVGLSFNSTIGGWLGQDLSDVQHFSKMVKALNFISENVDVRFMVECEIANRTITLPSGVQSNYEDLMSFLKNSIKALIIAVDFASLVPERLKIGNLEFTAASMESAEFYCFASQNEIVTEYNIGELMFTANLSEMPEECTTPFMTGVQGLPMTYQNPCGEVVEFFGNAIVCPVTEHTWDNFYVSLFCWIEGELLGYTFVNLHAEEGGFKSVKLKDNNFKYLSRVMDNIT
ncbi:hypothetical protein [Pseudomonas viridiflava]|uniref:hypothetical protein n=1 Tax=Pseudomonas viridiflava TaxID=33069 RepID=UPI000F053092|nr:hypothetical protein [Pseudomonas viridiflava]